MGLVEASLIVAGSNILGPVLGGLFGGGGDAPEVPAWLGDMILKEYQERSYEGFAPDRNAFTSSLNAEVQNILNKMGVRKDAFKAEAASRGVYTSGEGMDAMYSDVVAPAVAEAGAAAGRTMIQYEGLEQQGEIAAAGMRSRNLDRLLQFHTANLGTLMTAYQMDQVGRQQFWQSMGQGISSGGNNIMNLMLLKKFYPDIFAG